MVHEPVRALVIAEDRACQPWLAAALGDSLQLRAADTDSAAVLRQLAASRHALVFCEFEDFNAPERAQLVEAIADRFPELPIVAVGRSGNAETVLAAMRAGVRDFFVQGQDDHKLTLQVGKLLRRVGAATATAVGAQGSGKLYTVVGAQPHENMAFLAVHLALAFGESTATGERVLLVDAATPSAASAVFLNMTPGYSLPDAVHDVHRCDATLVDTAFARHSSGLYLLSMPEDVLARAPLRADDFGRLLQLFKSLFSTIVVAIDGQAGSELLRVAIEPAERLLVLTDQSILKSRQSSSLLRALRLEQLPLERAALVVDHYRRRLGLEPENLAQILDLPLAATLSSEGTNRIQAMNAGEPLYSIAPKDPYCAGVRALAAALPLGEAAQPVSTEASGLLGRLFG
jgi:pilus assembly protein CpaE